jgi:hypothetical protein
MLWGICGALDPATARRGHPIDLADEKHTILLALQKQMAEAPSIFQANRSQALLNKYERREVA